MAADPPSASTTAGVEKSEPTAIKMERRHTPRRPDIDGLRCIAVVAVLVFHLRAEWLPGGFTGVDCFFTMSGYVVMASLLKTLPAEGTPCRERFAFLGGFYARRVKRLSPALIFVVLLTAFTFAIVVPTDEQPRRLYEYWTTGQAALIGASNVRFAIWSNGGYWADDADSPHYDPFTHSWSLGVEEQYYLVFPLLVLLAYAPVPRRLRRTLGFNSIETPHRPAEVRRASSGSTCTT